tara:strand:- start:784 stop:1524 length:741 start_codon:yes stop_codon:yes gene_type:complete
MSNEVTNFLQKLEEINDEKIKIFVPSLKKDVETTPLTLKQQKDLIASTLDGIKGLLNFNKTLNDIVISNTGNKEFKIYDKFPFVIHLRKQSLGNKIKQGDTIIDLDNILKNIKKVPLNIKDTKTVTLKNLKVGLRIPTLIEESAILKKGEQDVVVQEDSTKEGVGMLYMLEILKYIENITIEEDIIEFSKIKISDRIKLIEQLPLSMYNEISEYIESVNKYLNDILTVDDIIVSIDTQFFDTSDID